MEELANLIRFENRLSARRYVNLCGAVPSETDADDEHIGAYDVEALCRPSSQFGIRNGARSAADLVGSPTGPYEFRKERKKALKAPAQKKF